MEPRHRVSPAGIALIKRFEGLRRSAARLPLGGWTVGYGHTRSAREGAQVDEHDAEALLRYDLIGVERTVNEAVYTPLTQNQYDALTAFAFSAGVEAFRRSNVLRRVNEGDLLGAAAALETWRRAEFEGESIVVDALVRRRAAEKALFLTPTDGFIPAPSAALKPQMDFGAPSRGGGSDAAEIVTRLDGDTVAPARAEGGLSPAQAAAAAVSRRLEALFPEDDAPAPVRDEPRPPELSVDPALSSLPDPTPEPAPAPPPPPQGLVEVITQAPSAEIVAPSPLLLDRQADGFDRRIAIPETPVQPPQKPESITPYILLSIIGFALFLVGVIVILQGRGSGETGLAGQQTVLGGVMGLLGIGAFCTAVYEWLKALGRNDGTGT